MFVARHQVDHLPNGHKSEPRYERLTGDLTGSAALRAAQTYAVEIGARWDSFYRCFICIEPLRINGQRVTRKTRIYVALSK